MSLKKNILFITEPLYQYGEAIRTEIEKLNEKGIDFLEVYYSGISNISDKENTFKRTIRKVLKVNTKNINRERQRLFFEEHSLIDYEIIIVLLQRGLCLDLFNDFIRDNNNAVKILYVWDDVARIDDFEKVSGLFDEIFSFDPTDCHKYGLKFRPLFYVNDYKYKDDIKNIDFSMIGTLHSDRAYIIDKLIEKYPRASYKWNVKLVAGKETIVKDLVKRGLIFHKPFYYHDKAISMVESADIARRSKIIIDIPVMGQNGLTMRTIESLAAKAKLITTNSSIREYDFYDERNIAVIDRSNPVIEDSFLKTDYYNIQDEVLDRYSINNWVKEILGMDCC